MLTPMQVKVARRRRDAAQSAGWCGARARGLIQTLHQAASERDHLWLNDLLQTKISPWYRLREVDRAYLIAVTKESMNMVGLCGGVPRPPLWPIREADRHRLRQIMSQLGYVPPTAQVTADQLVIP